MISLILIFGCLCRSSSWWLGPHIGVCRLLWPLLRASMGDFGPVLCELYLLWVWYSVSLIEPPKNVSKLFKCFTPQNKHFFQTLIPEWRSCSIWASTDPSAWHREENAWSVAALETTSWGVFICGSGKTLAVGIPVTRVSKMSGSLRSKSPFKECPLDPPKSDWGQPIFLGWIETCEQSLFSKKKDPFWDILALAVLFLIYRRL